MQCVFDVCGRLLAMTQRYLNAWLKWKMNRSKQTKIEEMVVVTRASRVGVDNTFNIYSNSSS
jgi:hypothetical protein